VREINVKQEKRSRFQIYFDILQVICCDSEEEQLNPTRIAHKSNLPYDRFRNYLNHLMELGMVYRKTSGDLTVTEKGMEFVKEYEKMAVFLKNMGLL
jgi:predicted transcriptional regulator